jgi:hypothetical protein
LGDPTVLPLAGWSIAPGLAAATSMDGLPTGTSLFTSPDTGTSDAILNAVQSALEGETVRLGQLLAPAGISTIVVMNSSAPELTGVQSVPLHPVPRVLLTALGRQSDLALELQTKSVEVFSNSLFHGVVAQVGSNLKAPVPLFSSTSNSGPVTPGARVQAGFAPASAFGLLVQGLDATRITSHTWTPIFHVGVHAGGAPNPSLTAAVPGKLVLQRVPYNAILAAFTLLMWLLVWLGFGWIHRLEWLFTGRRKPAAPRHAKDDHE